MDDDDEDCDLGGVRRRIESCSGVIDGGSGVNAAALAPLSVGTMATTMVMVG